MSSLSIDELQSIRSSYKVLREGARPEVSSGQCPHREYSFAEAAKFDSYAVPDLSKEEIIKVFNKITDPNYKEMTEADLFGMVTVALNIKHPITGKRMLGHPWTLDVLCSDFSTAKPSLSGKVSMVKEAAAAQIVPVVPASDAMDTASAELENIETQASAICFLFSWLTRFAVKSPSSALSLQYTKLRETFMKLYSRSSVVFDKFKPDSTWVVCLRNSFDAFVRVKNTLVLYVAASETALKGDAKAFNVMRYLFYQNLEFMGMHAYVSIVSIMSKVALPPALILTWLRMSGAELAIDEAFIIMSTLDNGMINDGIKSERLWKYARMLDAGFFNRLQTSYAAELMATLAHIEVKLGISQETGYSSPLNIYAIANNRHIKEVGRAKAEAFMECRNSTISLSSDASVVDKIYARKSGVILEGSQPMDEDPEILKRKADAAPEPSKKKRAPQINLPPPPVF